jgi:hypothetical protein
LKVGRRGRVVISKGLLKEEGGEEGIVEAKGKIVSSN